MEKELNKRHSKVFVRLLPSSDMSSDIIKVETDQKTLHVQCLQDYIDQDNTGSLPKYWCFTTDGFFYNVTQEDIYSSVMDSVLSNVLDGARAVVVCCGQAGSGKTYTAFGLTNEFPERGLAPRTVSALFDEKSNRQSTMTVELSISFVEFLGNEVLDLLNRENLQHQTSEYDPLKNVLSVPVDSEEEAMKLIFEGVGRRAICRGTPYPWSNRGHGVLTVHIQGRSTNKLKPVITFGMLHIVDLAGINSPEKNFWANPQDISNANLTKTFLEHVLIKINNPSCDLASLAKQLSCPLIHYLGSAFSRAGILRFIGHIHGAECNLDLTLSTLRFVEKVNAIKSSKLEVYTRPCLNLVLENFEDEEMDLWKQFREMTMLAEEPDGMNISQARVDHLRRLVMSFLAGEASEETILALQQTPLAIMLLKEEFEKVNAEVVEIKYKIDHLQFDDVHKIPSSARSSGLVIGSPSRERGKRKPPKHSLSKEVIRGPSLSSKDGKKKSNDSKETIKKVTKSSKDSVHTLTQTTISSTKDKVKRQESREMMKASHSASQSIGRTPISPNRLKRVVSQANKKVSNKGKSKETLSKLDEITPVEMNSSNQEALTERPATFLTAPIPSYRDAWDGFLKTDVEEMQTVVCVAQADTEQAHIVYSKAVVKLADARQTLLRAQTELMAAQHERHLRGCEAYDPEGRIITEEAEHKLMQKYEQRKVAVDVELEELKSAKVELDQSIQRLSQANKKLEDKFQEFCLANYQVPILQVDELHIKDTDKPSPLDKILEHRITHFHILQQIYFSSTTCTKRLALS